MGLLKDFFTGFAEQTQNKNTSFLGGFGEGLLDSTLKTNPSKMDSVLQFDPSSELTEDKFLSRLPMNRPHLKPTEVGGLGYYKLNNSIRISGISPDFSTKIQNIMKALETKGYQPRIASGVRTIAEQRQKVKDKYSPTMNSRHLKGRALDIVDKRYGWNIPQDHQFWNDLGAAAAKEGLTWGGNWKKFKDVAHIQY